MSSDTPPTELPGDSDPPSPAEASHPDKADERPGPMSSVGRRQIAALSDLIDLSNTCELTERELISDRDHRTAFVEKRYNQSVDRAETRAATNLRKWRAGHKENREAIEADAATRQLKLDSEAKALRAKIDGKAKDRESKSRGEYNHERWVADSVLEGRTNELKAELEKDLLQLEQMQKETGSTDQRRAETLKQYRQPPPPRAESIQPASDAGHPGVSLRSDRHLRRSARAILSPA